MSDWPDQAPPPTEGGSSTSDDAQPDPAERVEELQAQTAQQQEELPGEPTGEHDMTQELEEDEADGIT
jgi:hypothetical protein